MIDTADLQAFLTKIQGGTAAVDLLKIGQAHHAQLTNSNQKKYANSKFRIALDMEDCLDRFYGGYYSDWACGGQWNRAYQFVQLLVNTFTNAHIELIAFFDGTLKENKKQIFERNEIRQRTLSVIKHVRIIGTPPPKIWWLPPSGLRMSLRNALRSLNVLVVQTVCDHTMEVIDYFHEFKLDGILGLNPDYIIANSSRYFSSHDLRLSYKGALETKEFLVSKLLSTLSLTADHLPFVATLLGGYILIDEVILKKLYEKANIDYTLDFEARIRKIAEVVRNSPTNEIDEFIKHLGLEEWAKQVKDSVEYFQRKTKFSSKKYLTSKRKNITIIQKMNDNSPSVPLASESNESDTIAKKMLDEVNNLVDDVDTETKPLNVNANEGKSTKQDAVNNNAKSGNSGNATKKLAPTFVYALPGEVLKTSFNRHQRGIMDSRIYQLLTRKEIILPQILEDEQYRDLPSIHLIYRPARQVIYAILFNLYHQKYLCSKATQQQNRDQSSNTRCTQIIPEVIVSEWIWSPQNEYKKPDLICATRLPWAVPTIQRLWFGHLLEDKQRRMKAFLTVMRSDSPLIMNRSYVPQHMLVLACILRYIITNPDRGILSRPELDAFLATAFSPHILNVDYTQELVLPGVHLRGVFLATLFMQGVETATLANDACGVPLPWMMTNPWLFFDGKLFHLKLKMSSYVQNLRELCDDQIDIVLKVERFRKAILEDVEHLLLPVHMDPIYRPGIIQPSNLAQQYNKNQIHPIANLSALPNGSQSFYNAVVNQNSQSQANYYNNNNNNNSNIRGTNYRTRFVSHQQQHSNNRQGGYQLKVGGIVVGSWAGGAPSRNSGSLQARANRTNLRNRNNINVRLHRNLGHIHQVSSLARTITRNTYGIKGMRNRNRRNRKERSGTKPSVKFAIPPAEAEAEGTTDNDKNADETIERDSSTPNGKTNQASNLAKSMCHDILKEEDDVETAVTENAKIVSENESNGNCNYGAAALDSSFAALEITTSSTNDENDPNNSDKFTNKNSKKKQTSNNIIDQNISSIGNSNNSAANVGIQD